MSPSPRGTVRPEDAERILAALAARQDSEAELRAAVLASVANKGSVRELAALTGLSTNTVSRWKREAR